MEKKKNKWIILLIAIILLLVVVIVFLMFGREKVYVITLDTNGGTKVSNIKVKDGEITELPDAPERDGHIFVGWTTEEGKVVTKGTKVSKNTTFKAEWISEDAESVSIEFDTDGAVGIDNILIVKGGTVLLPVEPTKEGYVFGGWVNPDGVIITDNVVLNDNVKLKAVWLSEDEEIVTLNFDTDGSYEIKGIMIISGKIIYLPAGPTKEGFVFGGWVDQDGNAVTVGSEVSSDVTLKAVWKLPYTCPKDCTPIGDGSRCNTIVTKNMVDSKTCPSGYTLKNGRCIDLKTRYYANSIDTAPWYACNSSSEYRYTEIDESRLGALEWCVKQTSPTITKVCPSGYTKDGNICKKTQTLNCKAN